MLENIKNGSKNLKNVSSENLGKNKELPAVGNSQRSVYEHIGCSADLGVNFKIVQNRPTVKAVCTKISKKNFCIFVNTFIFLRENKEV